MERISHQGAWWPSSEPTLALGGTLSYVGRHSYELDISGSPEYIALLGEATIAGIPIYGRAGDGTDITVYHGLASDQAMLGHD